MKFAPRLRPGRLWTAGFLLAAATIIPCTAWYVVGSREAERESRELIRRPESEARRLAGRFAERLDGRLTSMLVAENQRPFYHYQHRYPDLAGDCECASWVESPLARGAAEPLIESFFEIDRALRLTVPQLAPNAEAPPPESARRLQRLLQNSAQELVAAATTNENVVRPASAAPARGAVVEYGDAAVYVEPFRWHTVPIDSENRLVALRDVRPPEGRLIQGFVISREAIAATVADGPFPIRFDAEALPGEIVEEVDLDGLRWKVAIDIAEETRRAEAFSARARRGFARVFWGGTGLAALAAVLVLGLVAQTERLATQRSRFAAAAAHELRTPLAGLRVYGEMLAEDLGDPESRRSYAGQIAVESERLGRVVSNVLGYTRLERGATEVRPRTGDLAAAVRAAIDRLRAPLEAAGARLDLTVAEPLPEVRFDPDALTHVLQNLVDNAERYARTAEDRTVRVDVRATPAAVRIDVIDHGPGIAPNDRRRLFRPFVRGSDPDAPAGLGLGLTLAASLVEAHGGTIGYLDTPGGGATFTVELPTS